MIYDQLNRLDTYLGLHPHLDCAIKEIQGLDLHQLPLGKREINGDLVYLMIQENTLDKEVGPDFEIHRDYLDIHFLLEGKEITRYGFGDRLENKGYDASTDFGVEVCAQTLDLVIDTENFALYFPGEAHRPNIYAHQGETVKKCVIKVLID